MKLLLVIVSCLILHAQSENPEGIEVSSSERANSVTSKFIKFCSTSCTCGLPNPIVAGATTPQNRFPWALQLMTIPTGTKTQKFICGATLINSRNAVTSANCFKNINTPVYARIVWLVGSQVRGFIRSVTIKIHPAFNQNTLFADLALVKFNASIPMGNGIVPICLTVPNTPFTGRTGYTASWGREADGVISNSIRVTTARIISNEACSKIHPNRRIYKTMLCAGPYVANTTSSCQSDYGGPLSVIDRSLQASGAVVNRHKLAGVGSYGFGCISQQRAPGVYTRISLFSNFIYANALDGCYCAG